MHMKRTADRLFGDQYEWSVLGAGARQMSIVAMAASMGGNVRVGLEDSLWGGPGKLAESNAEQVRTARQIVEGLGLSVATTDERSEEHTSELKSLMSISYAVFCLKKKKTSISYNYKYNKK